MNPTPIASSSTSTTEANVEATPVFDLGAYIYSAGFVHAAWADTLLAVPPLTTLRLHALIVARSPTIYSYLSAAVASGQGPPYSIQINETDPNLSAAAISTALATLYGRQIVLDPPAADNGVPAILANQAFAKGLIAAGNLFRLDDVGRTGYTALLRTLSVDTLPTLFEFCFERCIAASSAHIMSDSNASAVSMASVDMTYPGPYPAFTAGLTATLVDFLISSISHELILKPTTVPHSSLTSVLIALPYCLFKTVCESDKLKCRSQMERYSFARDLAGERERRRRQKLAAAVAANPLAVHQPAFEEGVVLAFGGGSNGGVEVIRKPVGKKKVLWKASQ
ncbi:hypothetical protein V1511DRAFT_461185 [Dipodascopsis uninucleata]